MAKKGQIIRRVGQEHRQRFVDVIMKARHTTEIWRIWEDLMYFGATMIAQQFIWVKSREDEYLRRIKGYNQELQKLIPEMLGELILAYRQEGFADVLGALYMELNLSNHWKGQFFTPDCICQLSAKLMFGNAAEQVKSKGYITVSDPCCGSGALLIAYAGECVSQNIDYQKGVLFVAQDVDPVVARMCYLSMSLLGMAGYVIIGNTLLMDTENYDYWYTPMYFIEKFHLRSKKVSPPSSEKESTV